MELYHSNINIKVVYIIYTLPWWLLTNTTDDLLKSNMAICHASLNRSLIYSICQLKLLKINEVRACKSIHTWCKLYRRWKPELNPRSTCRRTRDNAFVNFHLVWKLPIHVNWRCHLTQVEYHLTIQAYSSRLIGHVRVGLGAVKLTNMSTGEHMLMAGGCVLFSGDILESMSGSWSTSTVN